MTLHTCNKSAPASALTLCLKVLAPGDTLLLIEDGVFNVLDSSTVMRLYEHSQAGVTLCLLTEDLAARGISDKIPQNFDVVSYADFVRLSLVHDKVVSWV